MFVLMFSACYNRAHVRYYCVIAFLTILIVQGAHAHLADSARYHQTETHPESDKLSEPAPQFLITTRPARFEIEILNDNDMYLMLLQDQYYTNGLFINLRKSADYSKLKPNEENRLVQFTLGHQMYNSYTAQIDSIEAVDRPIAAYLFLSLGQRHHYRGEHFLGYSLELGTIGKRAFGEVLQVQLHRLLNMYHASGWEYQLHNAWGATLHGQYNGLIGRWGKNLALDLSVNPELSLGTHKTRFAAAPLIRLGVLNPFSQSAQFSARLQSKGGVPTRELYIFYRPEISFVYYDATLQGGMLVKEKGPVTVEPNPWVFSNQFGAVFASRAVTFQARYFFNTKESEQSMFRHQYGSLSLAYQF